MSPTSPATCKQPMTTCTVAASQSTVAQVGSGSNKTIPLPLCPTPPPPTQSNNKQQHKQQYPVLTASAIRMMTIHSSRLMCSLFWWSLKTSSISCSTSYLKQQTAAVADISSCVGGGRWQQHAALGGGGKWQQQAAAFASMQSHFWATLYTPASVLTHLQPLRLPASSWLGCSKQHKAPPPGVLTVC